MKQPRKTSNLLDTLNRVTSKKYMPILADQVFRGSPMLEYLKKGGRPVPKALQDVNALSGLLSKALLEHGREYRGHAEQLTEAFMKSREIAKLLEDILAGKSPEERVVSE